MIYSVIILRRTNDGSHNISVTETRYRRDDKSKKCAYIIMHETSTSLMY